MLLSAIPYKFLEIFGKNAPGTMLTTPIPQTTVSGIRASQDLGFPVLTATAIGAGGTPPDARDFNGVFQYLSLWSQWVQAGGQISYDSTFSTAIGGYPKGAKLSSTVTADLIWISTADNNTTDPDGGSPANWTSIFSSANTWPGNQSFTGLVTVPNATTGTQAVNFSQFPSSLGTYGWKRYPDPNSPTGYFIRQWGFIQVTNNSTLAVTLPIAFPNAYSGQNCSMGSALAAGTTYTAGIGPSSLSQIALTLITTSLTAQGINWEVWGY